MPDLLPLKPCIRTTVGPVGPMPLAAGTYQPAMCTPSGVTTSVPAFVPCESQSLMSGLAALRAASSAMS